MYRPTILIKERLMLQPRQIWRGLVKRFESLSRDSRTHAHFALYIRHRWYPSLVTLIAYTSRAIYSIQYKKLTQCTVDFSFSGHGRHGNIPRHLISQLKSLLNPILDLTVLVPRFSTLHLRTALSPGPTVMFFGVWRKVGRWSVEVDCRPRPWLEPRWRTLLEHTKTTTTPTKNNADGARVYR